MWPINKINKAIKRKKWRRLNSHNFTNPQNDFNFDLVSVGKGTYGGIYVLTFDDKHKLKIGNYCSIAPDVAFMLSADHPTDQLSTYPYKVKLLNQPLEGVSKGDIVVLQNEINNVPYIIERCYEKEMKSFFNAAPYDIAVKNYPIEKVTWLVVNETEGAALSNEEDYEKIIQTLKQKYPHTHILFTMGKEGSRVLTDKEDIKVEALKVNAVDSIPNYEEVFE